MVGFGMSEDIKPIRRQSITLEEFTRMRLSNQGYEVAPYHRPASSWEIAAKDERGTVTEHLLDENGNPFPEGLAEAIEWLQRYLAAVPEELRASAELKIGSVGLYEGDHCVSVEITYERPETDEEWAARKADVEARMAIDAERLAAKERAEFERLRAKFGDDLSLKE